MKLKYNVLYTRMKQLNNNNFLEELFINKDVCEKSDEISNNLDFIIVGCYINKEKQRILSQLKCYKILYVDEPIKTSKIYTDRLLLNNQFNMLVGCTEHNIVKNMFKYPLYINEVLDTIKNVSSNYLNEINLKYKNESVENISKKEFCCLINRHDNWKTRTEIYKKIKNIGSVKCPSILFNNCSNEELNNIGNVAYINKFKFNICSENTFNEYSGYITEKLINCCLAGSIPIYCGLFDEIDEKIFNKNRIIFYEPNTESIDKAIQKVLFLQNNDNEYYKFYKQDIFVETAFDTINNLENDCKLKFEQLYNNLLKIKNV